jgi:hypothetical protein
LEQGVIHRLDRTPGKRIQHENDAEPFSIAMLSPPGMAGYAFGSNPPYKLIALHIHVVPALSRDPCRTIFIKRT